MKIEDERRVNLKVLEEGEWVCVYMCACVCVCVCACVCERDKLNVKSEKLNSWYKFL